MRCDKPNNTVVVCCFWSSLKGRSCCVVASCCVLFLGTTKVVSVFWRVLLFFVLRVVITSTLHAFRCLGVCCFVLRVVISSTLHASLPPFGASFVGSISRGHARGGRLKQMPDKKKNNERSHETGEQRDDGPERLHTSIDGRSVSLRDGKCCFGVSAEKRKQQRQSKNEELHSKNEQDQRPACPVRQARTWQRKATNIEGNLLVGWAKRWLTEWSRWIGPSSEQCVLGLIDEGRGGVVVCSFKEGWRETAGQRERAF